MAIITALVIALIAVCLIAFNQPNDNAAARAKAVKLEALLRAEGLPLPTSLTVFSSSLGTNGGVVCAASGYNLTDAILNQQNSASTGAKTGSVLQSRKRCSTVSSRSSRCTAGQGTGVHQALRRLQAVRPDP